MEQSARLAYLQAMGIAQWRPRLPLVGAAPSPDMWWPLAGDSTLAVVSPVGETPADAIRRSLAEVPPERVRQSSSTSVPLAVTGVKSESVSFQLVLYPVVAGMLVVDSSPQLGSAHGHLLAGLLRALTGQPHMLVPALTVHWPPRVAKGIDLSAEGACEWVQEVLQGEVGKSGAKHVLLLGEAAQHYVMGRAVSEGDIFARAVVWAAPSLNDLLLRPVTKAQVWKALAPLQRVLSGVLS